MNVSVHYKNIAVGTIKEENLLQCVIARENQAEFFFEPITSREQSLQWIKAHRYGKDDVLYEITYVPDGTFLGTIGCLKKDNEMEIGRLAINTAGIIELIKKGVRREQMGEIGLTACIALITFIYRTRTDIDYIYAEVMKHNALSNRLCKEQCGTAIEKTVVRSDKSTVPVYYYRMSMEDIAKKYGNEKMDIFFA